MLVAREPAPVGTVLGNRDQYGRHFDAIVARDVDAAHAVQPGTQPALSWLAGPPG